MQGHATNLETLRPTVGYVPQDYALFPHLTVAENIVFGLRVRKVRDRGAKSQRVAELLAS